MGSLTIDKKYWSELSEEGAQEGGSGPGEWARRDVITGQLMLADRR